MKSINSRKGQTSITHLMNFSLPPRPSSYYQSDNQRRSQRRTWGLGSGHHAVDKSRFVALLSIGLWCILTCNRFVHANYRFIVDPRGHYHEQSVDADVYLDWSTILQILVSPQSQASACPICLGDPVAPRMAKCGHIFCLPCLIRYMHSGDDVEHAHDKRPRWKKCPICWDSIYISETRPVRWYIGQEGPAPREGEDIVLRLVTRAAGSTLALPKEGCISSGQDIPWHYAADVMDFARVMRGTADYMEVQYNEEVEQLREMERHDELMFGEDSEWTGKAVRSIREAKERLRELSNISLAATAEDVKPKRRLVPGQDPEAATAIDAGSPKANTLMPSLAQFRAQQNISHTPTDYHFYQALLHYYLSPLDIRILRAAFGDFTSFPSTILPRVERISTGHVVDDELRKRTKYLAHLPHGCEVNFLECDWTDTVPVETLEAFRPEMERRRKKNSDKEAREERDRVRAEKEEEAKGWVAARRKHGSSPVNRFQSTDFQPLVSSVAEASGSEAGLESTSPMWTSGGGNGSAFASLASPGTSPNAHRTVWGTSAIIPSSPEFHGMAPQDLGPTDDGWLQGWEKELIGEDELVARIEAVRLGESSKAGASAAAAAAGNAKKKKGKKITLMSTTARRGA